MATVLVDQVRDVSMNVDTLVASVTNKKYTEEDGTLYGAILRTVRELVPFDGTLDTYGDLALYDYSSEDQNVRDILDACWTPNNLSPLAVSMGGTYSILTLSNLAVANTSDGDKGTDIEITGQDHTLYFQFEFRAPLLEADITSDDLNLQWSSSADSGFADSDTQPTETVTDPNVVTSNITWGFSIDNPRYFRYRILKDGEAYTSNIVKVTRISI